MIKSRQVIGSHITYLELLMRHFKSVATRRSQRNSMRGHRSITVQPSLETLHWYPTYHYYPPHEYTTEINSSSRLNLDKFSTKLELPKSLIHYNSYRKIQNDFLLSIHEHVWTDRLKIYPNFPLDNIPYAVLNRFDVTFIERCYVQSRNRFTINRLPAHKITTTMILFHCLYYAKSLALDIMRRPFFYDSFLLSSLGNTLMYVLATFYRHIPWPITFETITKFDAFVNPLELIFLPGNHRKCLSTLPDWIQTHVFYKLYYQNLPLDQYVGYTLRHAEMLKLLKQKKKSIYLKIKPYQELVILDHKRGHFVIRTHNLHFSLLKGRRPTHSTNLLDVSYDNSAPLPLIVMELKKHSRHHLKKKVYIKVEMLPDMCCYLDRNGNVCMDAVRINLEDKNKISLWK